MLMSGASRSMSVPENRRELDWEWDPGEKNLVDQLGALQAAVIANEGGVKLAESVGASSERATP